MRYLRRAFIVLLCAFAVAGAAAAAPPQSQLAAQTNYTQAHRSESAIRFIVIHVSEGSFLGTVAWLRDPKAHSSANFVVGRKGQVQELVPLHDIAWHAGNWAYNLRSVGIENEGVTDDPAGFPMAEYRSTARLAAVIARRAVIPIDRHHIIGHYQVPDPNDPLQGGGIDNHTDPGKYWKWGLFMSLVKRFAYPQRALVHRHVGLQIDSSTLYDRQVVAGDVPWRAKVGGPVKHVSFLVDGKVRWVDRIAPFAFAGGRDLNTLGLSNGKHVLELRAFGAKSWTRHRFVVRVKNEPFTLATVGLKAKQKVTGVLPVQALFTGMPPARVLLYLDGRLIDHDTSRAVPLPLGHAPGQERRAHPDARRPRARRADRALARAGDGRERRRAAAADRCRLARRRADGLRPPALARADERHGREGRVPRRRRRARDVDLGAVQLRLGYERGDARGARARRARHRRGWHRRAAVAYGDGRGDVLAVNPA